MQYHKTLRHPSLLKFIAVRQSGQSVHIITEEATPLVTCQSFLSSWEVVTGLMKVLEALKFLHSQAGVSHNNISMESVFVTPDGEWKLGRLDCCQQHSETTAESLRLRWPLFDSDVYSQDQEVSHVTTLFTDMAFIMMCWWERERESACMCVYVSFIPCCYYFCILSHVLHNYRSSRLHLLPTWEIWLDLPKSLKPW